MRNLTVCGAAVSASLGDAAPCELRPGHLDVESGALYTCGVSRSALHRVATASRPSSSSSSSSSSVTAVAGLEGAAGRVVDVQVMPDAGAVCVASAAGELAHYPLPSSDSHAEVLCVVPGGLCALCWSPDHQVRSRAPLPGATSA
eukprot:m51a1_g6080 hypothetical protein (145) ;mRNA; f:308222-308944